MNEITFNGTCWMNDRFDFPIFAFHSGMKNPSQPWASKGLTSPNIFKTLVENFSDPGTPLIMVIPILFAPFFIPGITNYNKLSLSMLRDNAPLMQVDLHSPIVKFVKANYFNYPSLPPKREYEMNTKYGRQGADTYQVGIWTDSLE